MPRGEVLLVVALRSLHEEVEYLQDILLEIVDSVERIEATITVHARTSEEASRG